jgi:hypothetical protein
LAFANSSMPIAARISAVASAFSSSIGMPVASATRSMPSKSAATAAASTSAAGPSRRATSPRALASRAASPRTAASENSIRSALSRMPGSRAAVPPVIASYP